MFAAFDVLQRLDVDDAAILVEHLDLHVLGLAVQAVDPVGLAVHQGRLVGDRAHLLADQADRIGHAVAGGGDQLLKQLVGEQLLLHPGHLHDLLGELVGIHRGERILVLHLRGQQVEERVEALGQPLRAAVDRRLG